MSFLFGNSGTAERRSPVQPGPLPARQDGHGSEADRLHNDLMARRPALLEEKLKLHGRIIDEFNLALLEKLAPEELHRQVQAYV